MRYRTINARAGLHDHHYGWFFMLIVWRCHLLFIKVLYNVRRNQCAHVDVKAADWCTGVTYLLHLLKAVSQWRVVAK